MTSLRNLLRTAVLTTNPYWPFSRWNQWPYKSALYALARVVGPLDGVRSIYLRLPRGQSWIPGSSDIDLTIVLRKGLTAGEEYELLTEFWRRHGRLARAFPMLGEIEILDETELPAWLAWTTADPLGPSWTLLHGESDASVLTARAPHWRRRALITASWIYTTHLPRPIAQSDSALRRHDILRRVRKVWRVLEPILHEAREQEPATPPKTRDEWELIASAAHALEVAVRHLTGAANSGSHVAADDAIVQTANGQRWLIVRDGLGRAALAERIRAADNRATTRDVPLLVPRALLGYLVRHLEPKSYRTLTERGRVIRGAPALADIPPPGREEFAAHAIDRLCHLPIYVRGHELFSKTLSTDALDNQVNSLLTAVQFLRGGCAQPYPHKGEEHWNEDMPQRAADLAKVRTQLASDRYDAAHRAAFELMRSILNDASDLMSAAAEARV